MTREEAIANLKMISVAFVEPITKEQRKLINDTFDMAIEALKQEPITVEIINQYCKEHNYVLCEKGTEHGKMLTCPNCGLDVHSDFKYCPRCGERMKEGD